MKYEAPEMFELGDAVELTQAAQCGFVMDSDAFPRFRCRPTQDPPSTEHEEAGPAEE